jgi:DNA-binding response OmpR family regulator
MASRTTAAVGPTKPIILAATGETLEGCCLGRELEAHYRVMPARDGLDVVFQYERLSGQVVAVVVDAALRRLGAGVLAEWLHHIDPQLPIIILAGGADEDVASLGDCPAVRIVTGPFGGRRLKALLDDLI